MLRREFAEVRHCNQQQHAGYEANFDQRDPHFGVARGGHGQQRAERADEIQRGDEARVQRASVPRQHYSDQGRLNDRATD